ncbi:MAG: hypothetical protein CBC35_00940 [Planctomycetes bacterium TMED75]|nr:hypothetical protein [Planctomycetaceae bacterium]OUU96524.1 MAG: hypothetical protein CBC35_00940 [Planctomycetes bacterium TMED75]
MEHTFKIIQEEEQNGCWLFTVHLQGPAGSESTSEHTLRLSWEDYDLWVRDGTIEPEVVARAILRYLEPHLGETKLPARIDSSHPRRVDPDADQQIARLIDPVMFRTQ